MKTHSGLDDYAKYAFVVRERVGMLCRYQLSEAILMFLDRNSAEVTTYIDLQSEGLRDILRLVLHGLRATSLIEDKPSVYEIGVLYHERLLT